MCTLRSCEAGWRRGGAVAPDRGRLSLTLGLATADPGTRRWATLARRSVIDPYLKYPNLLGILINFLKTEQQLSIRRETMKVLGILGALDPYKHTVRCNRRQPLQGELR